MVYFWIEIPVYFWGEINNRPGKGCNSVCLGTGQYPVRCF